MKSQFILASLIAISLAESTGRGAVVLDQEFTAKPTPVIAVPGTDFAQTFTVQQTGELAQIDLQLWFVWTGSPAMNFGMPVPPTVVDLRRSVNGIPLEEDSGPNILASAVVPTGQGIFSWTGLEVPVQPGDELSVVLHTSPFGFSAWYAGAGSAQGYGGGASFARLPGQSWQDLASSSVPRLGLFTGSPGSYDLGFRTYVGPVEASAQLHHNPEPASLAIWSLIGIVALGTGWWRQRPRRKSLPA